MHLYHRIKVTFFVTLLASIFLPTLSLADTNTSSSDNKFTAAITQQASEKAKQNEDWKRALVTGKDAQVVLMNITPKTNPKNEIGMETHPFDQVIFVVEGKAKSILNNKISVVKAGDMIFIPQGTLHNFINLDAKKSFKIISVYSENDIPANAVYQKKSDMPQD